MSLPLEGIRILDLTRLLPGPHCTLMLADFGADVIKVEDPRGGDYARNFGTKVGEYSAMFASLNRNKRSITLDLKLEKEKKVFLDLVKTADVLVESFRPGVMKSFDLGYEELKNYNPRLIYCAITGYGQTGPYANKPGHDLNFMSYSGLLHLQGEQSKKPPVPSVQMGDIGGGSMMSTIGILIAIIDGLKTGKGQFIDISMLDCSISRMQTILPNYLASQTKETQPVSNNETACYEIYKTKDNRFLSVGAYEFKFWKNFCEVIGKEELISKLDAPTERQKVMKEEIQTVIHQKTLNEWLILFKEIDTCVSPILTPEEMLEDEHIQYRKMIEDVPMNEKDTIKQLGNPIRLSNVEVTTRRKAPLLGEHSREILKELGDAENNL